MNLELLLSLTCLISNNKEACISMANGYYKYEKLDEMAKNIEKKYPAFVFTTSLLSSIEQKKVSVPIYNGTYISCEIPAGRESKIFGGWNYGF